MREGSLSLPDHVGTRQFPSWLSILGLLAPATWLLGFWSLVAHARLVAGVWPKGYSGDFYLGTFRSATIDPGALEPHSTIVSMGMLCLMYFVPVELLFLGVTIFDKPMRQPPLLVLAFLVSIALVAGTMFLDPGGFFAWSNGQGAPPS